MPTPIIVEVAGLSLPAQLSDSAAARAVANALPLTASMSRWGDEYYGGVGLDIPEDASAREEMEIGEIAYWGPGTALCIFFGPTPASTGQRPRAASPVLPLGKLPTADATLRKLGPRVKMIFRKA